MNHLDEFNRAWETPQFTKIELNPVNINYVLKSQYKCASQCQMTKSQLWDMEVKKAYRPDLFIPSVVKPGTALAWGRARHEHIETFIRVSEQKLWLDPSKFALVIEHVHIDHRAQLVTFIGESRAKSEKHGYFEIDDAQPLFHVQHGVIGDENAPENTWRIVHLSPDRQNRLKQRFEAMSLNPWLPEYIEVYLRDVIGFELAS